MIVKRSFLNGLAVVGALLFVTGCSEVNLVGHLYKEHAPPMQDGPRYKVGAPYKIDGKWYHPREDYAYAETGTASWYGADFHGKLTANGERYDMNALTAAHRTLPMPSFVRVTNLENGRSLMLRVNDRGPFARNRIIDVSRRAAQLLGFEKQGTAKVRVQILAEESRAIAERMTGKPRVMRASASPSAPTPAPRVAVESQPLPSVQPVPVAASAAPSPADAPKQPPGDSPPSADDKIVKASLDAPESTAASREDATDAATAGRRIFVQAGAFLDYDNAFRLSSSLSSIGQANITQVVIDGRDFYRVRIGPVASMEKADRLLEEVVKAGHSEARLIIY